MKLWQHIGTSVNKYTGNSTSGAEIKWTLGGVFNLGKREEKHFSQSDTARLMKEVKFYYFSSLFRVTKLSITWYKHD